MDELISVIVPIYNVAPYVEKCIRSILAQTYSKIEVIIVNDGSTDDSLQIVRNIEKEEERIRIIDVSNGGPARARNIGLDAAKGKYILFVDGDDTIDENALLILYRKIIEVNADIATMRVAQVYADDHIEQFSFSDQKYDVIDFEKKDWFFKDASVFQPIWNKLYKRSLIQFRFDEQLRRNEDIEFNGKIYCQAKRMVVINQPLYYQLQRGSSLCHNGRKTEDEIYSVKRVYDSVVEYGNKIRITVDRKKEIMEYLYFRIDILLHMIIYDESGYKNRKKYIKQLREYFPKWRYTLVNDIKSYNTNKRFWFFKKLFDKRLYYFLYHYKDFANLIRPLRCLRRENNQSEKLFE